MLSWRTAVGGEGGFFVPERYEGAGDEVYYMFSYFKRSEDEEEGVPLEQVIAPAVDEPGEAVLLKCFKPDANFDPAAFDGREFIFLPHSGGEVGEVFRFARFADRHGFDEWLAAALRKASPFGIEQGGSGRFVGQDGFGSLLKAVVEKAGLGDGVIFRAGPVDAYSRGFEPFVSGVSVFSAAASASGTGGILGGCVVGVDYWTMETDADGRTLYPAYCLQHCDNARVARHTALLFRDYVERPDLFLETDLEDGLSRQALKALVEDFRPGGKVMMASLTRSQINDLQEGRLGFEVRSGLWQPGLAPEVDFSI